MPGENSVKNLVGKLSKFGVLVAADVNEGDFSGLDIEAIASRIIERMISDPSFNIINKMDISNIVDQIRIEKSPKPIEMLQKSGFKASASEIDARYMHIEQADRILKRYC